MERNKVYELINEEREYQDSLFCHSIEQDESYSISDWIIFMEHCLNKAKERIYYLSKDKALEEIRKITALGVACMEYNNTPRRE